MGFKTKLTREERGGKPAPQPPADVFQLVHYEAAPGKLAAYLTLDPQDGNKHPAIVWITGGDCNSIDQGCWKEGPRANDQSAAAYRKAGLVMMFPSLRGGNDNPGVKEGFLGEVDDVIAAANFLAKQPFVDPNRIYLGGQSTGGTLALLTAEYTDRFRAVFCFGPGCNVLDYGKSFTPFPTTDLHELAVRAPVLWLHSVRKPTFIFEGSEGNGDALRELAKESTNPKVHCFEVKGVDHFAVLAPTNELIAEKLLKDSGPTCDLAFTAEELNQAVKK